ncbi:MAG TPA: ABC transporter substrate-binding protein [Candidatus Binatia bacterium]|nr:ABC transporter substrate-binding protein [Candidatus Binatia bacterium]
MKRKQLLCILCYVAFAVVYLVDLANAQTTAPSTLLNVVYSNVSVSSAPLWVTQEAGIFRKHGLDARLSFARGTLAAQAMLAGSFPVGYVSSSNIVTSNLAGARLELVAGLLNKMVYALVTARDITTAAQLRGKRIGISSFGASSETATRYATKEVGLDPDRDVIMLQVGNSAERFAALASGRIEGMLAEPADVIRAKKEGFNILLDLTTRGIDYQSGAVAMTENFIRDHRETALNFLRALIEGVHYFKTRREESVRVAAKYLKSVNLEAISYSWQVHAERLIPAKPYPTSKGMQLVIREVAQRNPAASAITPEQLFDTSLIEEIDRSGFIDRLYR